MKQFYYDATKDPEFNEGRAAFVKLFNSAESFRFSELDFERACSVYNTYDRNEDAHLADLFDSGWNFELNLASAND